MDPNTIEVVLKLRKDTEINYNIIKDIFIPENGEVCLVDTELYGLRSKVGDGFHTFAQLEYNDKENNVVIRGHYLNQNFYSDTTYTVKLEKCEKHLYIDKNSNGSLYIWNGTEFVSVSPNATDTVAGIMKLYQRHGYNSDGTMSQRAITNCFDDISLSLDTVDPECLVLDVLND